MPSSNDSSNFKLLLDFKSDYSPSHFSEYVSGRTGMRVVVVNQKGPKVYGYFALATEIHDDSGAPHTLEHLVFMGSKSYKYKGLLDKLATRAYSNTNAWTATDHTAYTLETAGWDGFAQILPVYLEHVLVPTLTDAGCYTEVHHIDGTGRDAGVVYSEMQGRQNQLGDLMMLQAKRLLYPESIGFRYETGGMMEQLRILTAERIRAFHREMYQPKNLCVVVMGEVDQGDLLKVLDGFESTIVDDVPRLDEPFVRPWSKAGKTPILKKSVIDVVEFPEGDESVGEVLIAILGPDCNDNMSIAALNILLSYLCGSSISILENVLVEKEALASSVFYNVEMRPDTCIMFYLTGVETEKLETSEKRFFELIDEVEAKPLDMDYMRDCLHRFVRQVKAYAESSVTAFSDPIICDHMFGNRDGSDLRLIADLDCYKELESWDEPAWHQFFSKWIAQAHHISILGKPSRDLSKKIKTDEKARVKAQREKLGEEGLKQLHAKLEAATAENDREIPRALLNQFEVPGTDSIHFIPSVTAGYGSARQANHERNSIQDLIDQDKTDVPLFIHFEHITTNFVAIDFLMNTHTVPTELKPLLPLYLNNFFNTPLLRDGIRTEFEEVVNNFEKDTVIYSMDDAASFGNPELLRIRIQIEPPKYEAAITWLKDFLYNSIFDQVRLKSTLAKLLADIPEEKRSGSSMSSSALFLQHNTRDSSFRSQDTLVKAVYLRRVSQILEESPETVIANLEKVRTALAKPSNFRILVIADLESGALPKPASSWEPLAKAAEGADENHLAPLDSPKSCLSEAGKSPGKLAYIVPMSTIDSSYASIAGRGLDSYDHPLLPALTVTLAYLEVTEGPLWTAVRGTGLAYGVWFARDVERGLLKFKIYRSPDAYKAFAASRKTVEDLASGKVSLEPSAMEGAVSSVVVSFADEQPSAESAALVGFINQVIKSIDKHWGREFMKKVRNVTEDDVRKALKDIVLPLFKPGSADFVVTCATIMQEQLVNDFKKDGYSPEVQPLPFFHDSYNLEGADAVEEALEDEEDEGGNAEDEGLDKSGAEEEDDDGEIDGDSDDSED